MKKEAIKEIRIQDDLYGFVNAEWIKNTSIPSDMPATNSFAALDKELEAKMILEFSELAQGKRTTDIGAVNEAVKLFSLAKDETARAKSGISPLLPLLDEIKGLMDIKEFNGKAHELYLKGVTMPFTVEVVEDFKDSTKYTFGLLDPSIILPDTSYYDKKLVKTLFMSIYKKMVKKVLKHSPLKKKEQKLYLADTILFDDKIRRFALSQLEMADYTKMYNPKTLSELAGGLASFDLQGFLAGLYENELPRLFATSNPRLLESFGTLFNEETFEEYKHWAYVNTLLSFAPFLSVELSNLASSYMYKLVGIKKAPDVAKQAYRIASSAFSDPIGVYYGRTYFGEEAKSDVIKMVKEIIETYKERMSNNTFLTEDTKKKAISKLAAIKIKMGYPDSYDSFFDTLTLDGVDSFYDAMIKIKLAKRRHNLDKVNREVDRSEWAMPAHMVNACYDPLKNEITFPAAILQPPFYSINQKREENLGGIGAVIGHEISHAFDNNGAKMDENGTLNNWWSEEDFTAFDKLTRDMAEQFDGIEYHGGRVNGTLTVSENIADNGGVAVTLDMMSKLEAPDYQAYFINWARVWRQKASEAYIKLLLTNDVHSPAELRANMQPRNFKEWYTAFGVEETDGMYIPEDKRIIVW